jgi:hypothetical protein
MITMQDKKIPITLAVTQWLITTVLRVDRLFFTYDSITKYLLATKLLYLWFLIVAWCFGHDVYKKIKAGNENYKRGFFIFKFYLFIAVLLLLILWPGTWSWDDLWTIDIICGYGQWDPWQHIITGAYQSVLLQILPFPGGIILLQNVIISACVAFAITRLETIFEIKKLKWSLVDGLVKVIPFLLPPVLMYQFSGYRMGMYIYIELVMIVMLIGAVKGKEKWTTAYFMLFCGLCIIVSTWRTEAFFYIPCACILLLFVNKDVLTLKRRIVGILIICIGFVGVTEFQNLSSGMSNDYKLVSLINPGTELVRVADVEEDAGLLADIDKVTKLEVIYNNPTQSGLSLYWDTDTDVVRDGYTNEDYHNYVVAIVKLSLKYPDVVIAERWNMFIRGSGITGAETSNVERAAKLFDDDNNNAAATETLSKGWIANTPVFEHTRKQFIYLLGMKTLDGSGNTILHSLFWNSLIPIGILIYAWIKLLIKKKWCLLGICTAVIIRIPVVILTEPLGWIMYHLSFYLLGYVYLVYSLLLFWSRRKDLKRGEMNT